MEYFNLKTISSKEKVFILNLNNTNEKMIEDFLYILGNAKVNIDSIAITNNGSTNLILMLNKKYEKKIYELFEEQDMDTSKILEKSSFEISGVGIRGENGYILNILNNLQKRKINLEFLVSGALTYELYIKKEKFSTTYKVILNSMKLPNINFE